MTPIGQEDISLTKSLSRKKLRQEDESIESDEHYFLISDEEYQVEQEQDGGNHETSQELNGEGNELDEEEKLLYLYDSSTETESENDKYGNNKEDFLPTGASSIKDRTEMSYIVKCDVNDDSSDDSSDDEYGPVEIILLDESHDKDYDGDHDHDEISARSIMQNKQSYRDTNSLISSSSCDNDEVDHKDDSGTSDHEADTQHQILEFVASPLNGRKPNTRKRRSRKHKMTQSIKSSASGDNPSISGGEGLFRETSSGGRNGITKGKWSLGDRIGQGSFGVVHKGMNGRSGKLMAVKCLCIPSNYNSFSQALVVDLEREIGLMKSFDQKNIVLNDYC